jgi:hypothetical protein
MRDATLHTIVGALWGGSICFLFGAFPAYGIVFGLIEDLIPGNREGVAFGVAWASLLLFSILLGAISGYIVGRSRRSA